MARVSVIIPFFNSARTLRRTLESVFDQTFDDFEIIAVNDGSGDEGAAILKPYAARIKLLEQPNRGPAAARNLGFRHSSGEYAAFLDADDWWMPDMLATLVPALASARECVLAYGDLAVVDSIGRELGASLAARHSARAPTLSEMLHGMWPIMPSAALMRRNALEAVGGFPEELRSFEDVYLWLTLREHGPFAYVPRKVAAWRFAHFPEPLKPTGGHKAAVPIFRRLVRERYGLDPVALVDARQRAPRSILGYIGLRALARGDRKQARKAFGRALRLDPFRLKNYLRWARTYLPSGIAKRLSGSAGRTRFLEEPPAR